jgi:Ca2+-binding EF-hand superfamily protein
MKKILVSMIALTIAAPAAAAQKQGSTQESAPESPSNATPGTANVTSIVDAEFPSYDANQSGQLERPEFTKWMIALKTQEIKAGSKALPASELTAWANGAFTSADTDGSAAVSKSELIKYLSGGAG